MSVTLVINITKDSTPKFLCTLLFTISLLTWLWFNLFIFSGNSDNFIPSLQSWIRLGLRDFVSYPQNFSTRPSLVSGRPKRPTGTGFLFTSKRIEIRSSITMLNLFPRIFNPTMGVCLSIPMIERTTYVKFPYRTFRNSFCKDPTFTQFFEIFSIEFPPSLC